MFSSGIMGHVESSYPHVRTYVLLLYVCVTIQGDGSPQKKKKKEEERVVRKWWEEEKLPEGIKWKTLEHKVCTYVLTL